MPSLDKLASLSRRMKETSIVVQPGGGQDGTEEPASVQNPASVVGTFPSHVDGHETRSPSAQAQNHSSVAAANGAMSALDVGGLSAAMLSVRDAVHGVASEIRLMRVENGGGSASSPKVAVGSKIGLDGVSELASMESRMALLTDEVAALREQLEVQAIQLAEILKLLR